MARPRPVHRLLRRLPDRQHIVAVHRHPGDAVGRRLARDVGVEGRDLQRRRRGVEVVFAHEHDRGVLDAGEIHRLVERAQVGAAVAEEGHRHLAAFPARALRAAPDRRRIAAAHDPVGPEQARPWRHTRCMLPPRPAQQPGGLRRTARPSSRAPGIPLARAWPCPAVRAGHPVGCAQAGAHAPRPSPPLPHTVQEADLAGPCPLLGGQFKAPEPAPSARTSAARRPGRGPPAGRSFSFSILPVERPPITMPYGPRRSSGSCRWRMTTPFGSRKRFDPFSWSRRPSASSACSRCLRLESLGNLRAGRGLLVG